MSGKPSTSAYSMDDPLDRTQSQHIHRRGFTRRGALAVPAVLVLSSLIASQYYNGPLTHLRVDYSAPIAVGVHEPGLPQQPIDWRDEDAELRNYTWTSPAPDPSLARLLGNLSDVEKQTRDWLFETRVRSMAGVGVGLGRTEPPENLRPGPAAPAHNRWPTPREGPGVDVYGSPAKFYELVDEWRTGRPLEVCKPAQWQHDYAKLHAEMLAGEREPKLIEYLCQGLCGGIADRLVGILGVFLYGVISGRAMSVAWQHPCPFDLIFDSPRIDWSQRYIAAASPGLALYENATLVAQRKHTNVLHLDGPHIDAYFSQEIMRDLWNPKEPWLRFESNRGVLFRSFQYQTVQRRLRELGLQDATAYNCLISYLIRPKPAALMFIQQYSTLFALPSVYSIGIQIRTGDKNMRYPGADAENTVTRHQHYFACADAVARTYAHPAQRPVYYLMTDSKTLREDALQSYPDRLVVSGLTQSHMEIAQGTGEDHSAGWTTMKEAADGMMTTVAESWTFAATDFSILTLRSGFGNIPTWFRGKEGRVIQLFNPLLEPAYTATLDHLPGSLDCTLDSSLSVFSDMGGDWSLG